MYNITYKNTAPIEFIRKINKLTEAELAKNAGLSRLTIRAAENKTGQKTPNISVESLSAIANALNQDMAVLFYPKTEPLVQFSAIAVSIDVVKDGFDSWKIHFMNYVDEVRRSHDPRLMMLPPIPSLDQRLQSLLASMTCELCFELQIDAPSWVATVRYLDQPWFPSGMESMKATAIVESPYSFRKNNIFVLQNFLTRA